MAINSLKKSLDEIQKLKKEYPHSPNHIKWFSDTLYLLEDIFGHNSRVYLTLAALTWQPTGTFFADRFTLEGELDRRKQIAFLQQLGVAEGIIKSGIQQIRNKGIKNVYEGKDTPPESSEIIKIISLIDSKLRKIIRAPPSHEKEIQDALESLFIAANLDGQFTREKENIAYSSKSYIPDFIFFKIDTIIEVKLCKTNDKEKAIISEINDDIIAYKTKYSNLIFVVYDIGIIRDQDLFRSSLEASENVVVKVVKH